MKKLILALVIFYPLFSFAQFSDYYNYYLYIPRGETASSTKSVQYVHFDRNEKLYCSHILNTTLKRISKDGIIDEYAVNKSHNCKYDTKTSTHKYEVYVEKIYSQQTLFGSDLPAYDPYTGQPISYHSGYKYYAFSSDRSEMITWTVDKDDDTPRNKRYYKLVKINDLVPSSNSANYDFLR